MQKIVINCEYGGFSLSKKAIDLYKILTCAPEDKIFYYEGADINRSDETLVRVVQDLGAEASGSYAALKVIEVPDDVEWHIEEYDGLECVAENHRKWY